MPLLSTAETRMRKHEKSTLVLRFLRETIYSTADILGQVMNLRHRSTILRSLERMEAASLITHGQFQEMGGIVTLWGITATGQDRALRDGEEPNPSVFNPSKISITNLLHYLDMQRIHAAGENAGWKSFQYVDRHRRKNIAANKARASATRPDLTAISPQGNKGAIECERVRKSAQRYTAEIIPGHVRNLNAGEYEFVLWITRTPEQQQELYELFQEIVRQMRQDRQWYLNVPPQSFKTFQFANLQTWPNY